MHINSSPTDACGETLNSIFTLSLGVKKEKKRDCNTYV